MFKRLRRTRQREKVLLAGFIFGCKLPTPTTAVAGTLLSPLWDLALPSSLGGAFFWSNLRDLFNDDLRAGVLRV